LLETLAILAQSLETQQVTFVLDTSYRRTGQLLRGNLRSRSPLIPMAERPGPQELAFQEQLKGRSSRARQPSVRGIPPGALLLAAADTQMAAEGQWSGFSAGLFTYALVQHLWQATPPATLYVSLARASERMGQWSAQRPQLQTSKQLKAPPLTYFVPPMAVRGAEGVAIALEDDRSTFVLHLAGLPPTVLEYYQPNSRLSLSLENGTESEPEEIVQLQIRSREGLRATAKLVGEGLPEGFQFQPRLLARERIRILPRHVGLRIALGADLERIERVDATSAFSNIAVVSSIASAGEQGADCLFAKSLKSVAPSESGDEESAKAAPETASRGYELFSIGRVSLPNTAGSPGEAIALAVERLTPKLKTLLAVKLLRLTLNEGSSHLKARARLVALEPVPKIAIERAALRSQHVLPVDKNASETSSSNSAVQTLAPHSRIQYVVENGGEHSLYVALLGLDPLGRAIALYAPKADGDVATLTQIECQPGTSLTIPHKVNSDWRVADAPGWAEMYLIVSRSPLTQTLKALSNCGSYSRSAGEQLQEAHNPLDVARSLLQDLHEASTVSPEVLGSASEVYAFDVKAWATFSFIYQVVQG
ncbi:MAG: peptidase C14, partial [Cyanobacteriota bacterium]|nr:peptidase C14 [Cyanobacteriota bacterium]